MAPRKVCEEDSWISTLGPGMRWRFASCQASATIKGPKAHPTWPVELAGKIRPWPGGCEARSTRAQALDSSSAKKLSPAMSLMDLMCLPAAFVQRLTGGLGQALAVAGLVGEQGGGFFGDANAADVQGGLFAMATDQ